MNILNIPNSAKSLTSDRPRLHTELSNGSNLFEGFDHSFKIILLGASNSGKTSLLIRFVDEVYNHENTMVTVVTELKPITLKVDNTAVRLQIWDTSG